MALPLVISSNKITSNLFSALDILDFLFTFSLILGAGRCYIKENTRSFAWENLPAFIRDQHPGAPSISRKRQATINNSVGLCSCVFLHPCWDMWAELSLFVSAVTSCLSQCIMHRVIWTEPGDQCQHRLRQQIISLGVSSCQDPQLLLQALKSTWQWLALTHVFLMSWLSYLCYSTSWREGEKKKASR